MDLNYPITRYLYRPISVPVASMLARTSVTPIQVTWVSAVLAGAAGVAFATSALVLGAGLTLVASITDCIDGDLARLTGRGSRAGAFLDSVLDRWTDAALIMGLAISDSGDCRMVALVALSASLVTSYTRARAQSLGTDCPDGIATRDARMLILVVAALLGLVCAGLVAVAVLGGITTVQRGVWSMRSLARVESPADPPSDEA
jgi:phosphatidylglycerophosphate synthase